MKNFITNYEIKLIFGIDCNCISRSRHPQHGETRNRQRGGAGTRIYSVGIEHVTQHEIVNLPRTSTRERLMKEIWWRVLGEVNLQFFT